MELNNHQGWYGETFVAAIAAAAGFQVAVPYPDIGKDLILGRDHEEPELDVQIALQVKSRRVGEFAVSDTGFKIALPVEQYKRLRGGGRSLLPRDGRGTTGTPGLHTPDQRRPDPAPFGILAVA